VFDRVWQLSYDDAGRVTFRDRPQRLLPRDAEK
jgi:YD repeat-containing protein